MRIASWRLIILAAVLHLGLAAGEAVADPEITGGLAITVGPTDGKREAALVEAGRFLVAHVTSDDAAAQALRQRIAQLGLAGAVTVVSAPEPGKLPFIDDLAALMVLEGEGIPADREILRVLRPKGEARIRSGGAWRKLVRPWPAEYADWGQFQRDESFNEVSPDRAVGKPTGFQWIADHDNHNADILGVRVADGICVAVDYMDGSQWRVVARDAFSGIELWTHANTAQKQLAPFNQYGFLVAEGRVYLHWPSAPHAISLDLRTGRPLTTFDQGLEMTDAARKGIELRRDLVHRGVLIQVFGPDVRALDFATGRLLWKKVHPEGRPWDRPAVEDGILVLAEGSAAGMDVRKISGYIRSYCTEVEALVGISVADGTQLWRTPLPAKMFPFDNCIRDGRYFLSMTTKMKKRSNEPDPGALIPTVCVGVRDGRMQWTREMEWPGKHPPLLMATADRVWQTSHDGGVGLAVSGTGDFLHRTDLQNGRELALWGCNSTWMTERFFHSRLGVTEIESGRVRFSTAVRSACMFGTTPACGLLYSTPHVCGCHAVVNGYNAVHSRDLRPLRKPWAGKRLIPGEVSRTAAAAGAGTWPAADEWPVYLRDTARTSWVETTVAGDPKPAWTVPAPATKVPKWLTEVWSRSIMVPVPVTALTVAEGIVAGAYPDQHAVFALDAASGKARWTAQLDSAIDSPPTIHRGSVYVGTRAGWVWALDRDTGAVRWRFMAAPHQLMMVVNGRVESVWPVPGSVAVHDGRLWVTAGRSAELDEGLHWWSLDLETGTPRSSGTIFDDEEWFTKGKSRTGWSRIIGINSPLAINGDFAMLAPAAFRPSDGALLGGGKDYASSQYDEKRSYQTPVPLPGMYGLVYNGEGGGGRTGALMVYGGIGGRIIAYRKDDFVGLAAGKPGARGGGGPFLGRWSRIPGGAKSFMELSAEHWTVRMEKKKRDTSTGLAVAGGTVVSSGTTAGKPRLMLHAYADGKPLSELPLPAPAVFGGICAAKGVIYVACADGSITALR